MQEERFSVVNMDNIIWFEWIFNCGTKSKKVAWRRGTQVKNFYLILLINTFYNSYTTVNHSSQMIYVMSKRNISINYKVRDEGKIMRIIFVKLINIVFFILYSTTHPRFHNIIRRQVTFDFTTFLHINLTLQNECLICG